MCARKTHHRQRRLTFGCVLVLCLLGAGAGRAQETSKDIRSEEVIKRPARARASKGAVKPRRPVTYQASAPFNPTARSAQGTEVAQVGITVWRLQGSAKSLEQEGAEASPQLLETLGAGAPLAAGDRVRIGIEPLMADGYLYIINREQYADGSFGVARLIFPTLRTRNGDNHVQAHQLIYIPARPSYFKVNPRGAAGKQQVAEVLTVIIAPTPLNLPAPLGDTALTLDTEQVAQWERLWGQPGVRLEMEDGAGRTMAAQQRGTKGFDQEGEEAPLTEDDPLPQTIYRVAVKAGNPLLVTVPLRFKAPAP